MGFSGAMADTLAGQLSGGEKARLLIGLAAFAGPHLLVLDEPTNHLDIDSRAALIEAINGYAGAIVLVSHDRYLLDACADRLLLVSNGGVAPFDGDLDDYRELILRGNTERESERGKRERTSSRTDTRRAAAEKRAELAPLRRRIAKAESEIERLTGEIARIDNELALPGLFAGDPGKAAQLGKARAAAVAALAQAESEWLDASSEYESETAQS
jgi:ATP-binding cassette subfamily F protein 3